MNNLEYFLQFGLPLANSVMLVACLWTCARTQREVQQQGNAAEILPQLLAPAEPYDDQELRRMVDRRLTIFEERLLHTVRQQQKPVSVAAPVPPLKNELPVEYAVRMARSGAGVDDLVRGCGLNIGEAQLLLRLHSSARAPATAVCH